MTKKAVYPAVQAVDGFPITPSDTVNVVADVGNTELVTHCFVHNVATGATVRVLPASAPDSDARALTIYIAQGGIFPMPVKRIYATTPTAPVGLVGLFGTSNI